MKLLEAAVLIKKKALELGFSACGIAKADAVDEEAVRENEEWLNRGCAAGMDYLNKNKDKRYDPRLLFPGAKTLIVTAMNYYPSKIMNSDITFSYYSYGMDYHFVVKKYLTLLYNYIEKDLFHLLDVEKPLEGRAFTDSAPLMERYWAKRAGIGFQGKNQLIIIPHVGSFCFIGTLILNIDLPADRPLEISCGNCLRCHESCPTHALSDGFLDSAKCISYQTIENRSMEIPPDVVKAMQSRVYGCDVCQLACPWNRDVKPTTIPEFEPSESFLNLGSEALKNLRNGEFKRMFYCSAISRVGLKGLKRNISSVKNTAQ